MATSQETTSSGETDSTVARDAAEVMECRRCGRPFGRPPEGMVMASCPHCGAAVRPLWGRIADNRNAAVLALLAVPVLTMGIVLPFISMSKLGHERVVSLAGGIKELLERGPVWLGVVLLVFSVIFPYAKLLAILVATSALVPISDGMRHRLTHLAHLTGRYSLLDIVVVAILIVVVKLGPLAEVKAGPGTVWFTVAVFMSIGAGMCVRFEEKGPKAEARGAKE